MRFELSPGSHIQFCKICALAGFVFGSMRFILLAAMDRNLQALRGVIFPLSFRYLLHYLMGHKEEIGIASVSAIAALLSAIVFLVVFGKSKLIAICRSQECVFLVFSSKY
jgi:hypothetical protein